MQLFLIRGNKMALNEKILTVNETAKLMQVHPNTVYKWLKQDGLSHIKFGSHYRIFREDLEVFCLKKRSSNNNMG